MRYSSSKFKKFKWQYLITIFVVLLTYGRDEVYFFNGLGGLNGIGENIVFREGGASRLSYAIVEVFQRSLMYSDGHRQNLLNPNYTKFGYGIAVDPLSRKIYAVQNFQ